MHPLFRVLFPTALLIFSGCVAASPHTALPTVQTQVQDRAGIVAAWPLTAEDRAASDAAVQDILSTDLTESSAVRLALLNNRSLRATFEELGLSQASLAAATRLPNPSFEASVRWPHNAPRGPNAEFGLSAPLFESLLLPARKQLAQNQLAQTQYRVSHEILALVASVRSAVYAVIAQQEIHTRFALIAEINHAAADVAQRQFDAGNIAQLDLARLQVVAQQADVELARIDAETSVAREKLNRLLGLASAQTGWKITRTLPALPASDELPTNLDQIAQTQRLDLAALHAQAELAQKAFELKRRTRFLPGTVDLGIDTERETDGNRVTGPRVSAQLPLFDQGQPELARLSAESRKTQDEVEALAAEIGSEVRSAQAALLASRRAAEFYQLTLLPQRQVVLRESLLHYNAMQKSVFELLTAKEQQQQTERESITAVRDYWLARIELERAIGQRLPATTEAIAPAQPNEAQSADAPAESHHHDHSQK